MLSRKENNKRVFISCPFYFTLLSVINLSKTKPNHSYLFWGGYLIGVKNNKKPSPGPPKGGQGHLTGVAV